MEKKKRVVTSGSVACIIALILLMMTPLTARLFFQVVNDNKEKMKLSNEVKSLKKDVADLQMDVIKAKMEGVGEGLDHLNTKVDEEGCKKRLDLMKDTAKKGRAVCADSFKIAKWGFGGMEEQEATLFSTADRSAYALSVRKKIGDLRMLSLLKMEEVCLGSFDVIFVVDDPIQKKAAVTKK